MNYPSIHDDVIDSRDVIETIQLLREILDDPERPDTNNGMIGDDNIDPGYLAALEALSEQGADYAPDWEYGATLIRDSHFKEYAQELADELDLVPREWAWPTSCIDWDQAALELRMDYTSIEFDDVTYWVR